MIKHKVIAMKYSNKGFSQHIYRIRSRLPTIYVSCAAWVKMPIILAR